MTSSHEIGTERLRWIAWLLEGTDVALLVSPGLVEVAGTRLHVRPVAGLPLLNVEAPEFRGFRRVLKGTFDRVSAGVALLLLSPLLLALGAARGADQPGRRDLHARCASVRVAGRSGCTSSARCASAPRPSSPR